MIAVTLMSLGEVISSCASIGGGITNKSMDKFVRLGVLVAAALTVVQLVGDYPFSIPLLELSIRCLLFKVKPPSTFPLFL